MYTNSNVVCFLFLNILVTLSWGHNLTCYQCVRYVNEPCTNDSLVACPPVSDRCVTHISKDYQKGYVIKRECGLGPCGFEDDMVNKGLGLDGCDRSKDEYFCVSCCRTHGCNKNSVHERLPSFTLTAFTLTFILHSTFYLLA